MSSQKGTSTALIVLAVAVLVVLGGAYFMMNGASTETMQGAEAGAVVEGENAVSGDASLVPVDGMDAVNVEVEAAQ